MAYFNWDESPDYQDGSIFDVLEEPVYIMDFESYDLLYLNKTARERLGYVNKSYFGVKCYKALRDRSSRCEFCGADLLDERGHYVKELFQPRMSTQHLVKGSLLRFQGHRARLELCVDVEMLTAQSEKLKLSLAAEAVLNDAVHSLYVNLNTRQAIDDVLQSVGKQLNAERSYMVEFGEDNTFSMTHEWCAYGIMPVMEREQHLDMERLGRWMDSFRNHHSVIVNNIELIADEHPLEYDLMAAQDVVSYALLPVYVEQAVHGYIGFENLPEEQLQAAGDMLSTLAYFIGTSLVMDENRRLLEAASYTDAMTGVGNRNAFMRDIERLEKDAKKRKQQVGVLFLDLNGLKKINDQQGHRAGDKAISSLAEALAMFFRRNEIYRTGGDEFVVLSVGIPERLFRERMVQAMHFMKTSTEISVSIGSAWNNDLAKNSLYQTISHADERMYLEKQRHYEELENKERFQNLGNEA